MSLCLNEYTGIILEGRIYILFQISLKLVPGVPVKNKSIFIQVMACCQTGIKLFIESMLIPPKLQWIANWCPASLEFAHYSGITGVSWSLKSETTGLFVQWLVQANIKETPTLCITGHFGGNKFVDSNLMVVVLDWSKREMITFLYRSGISFVLSYQWQNKIYIWFVKFAWSTCDRQNGWLCNKLNQKVWKQIHHLKR